MDFLVTIIELLRLLHSTKLYQESSYRVSIQSDNSSMPKLINLKSQKPLCMDSLVLNIGFLRFLQGTKLQKE